MFCRFCGAQIPPDSHYCSKCGKRLVGESVSGLEQIVRRLHLRTPYPYAGVLCSAILLFVAFAERSHVDYTGLRLALELVEESALAEPGVFQHRLSLTIENVGTEPVGEVPVDFRARVEAEPDPSVEITSEFSGREFVVFRNGAEIPLGLVLTDPIAPARTRHYRIENRVLTPGAPALVTYEVLAQDTDDVLASVTTGRQPPALKEGF